LSKPEFARREALRTKDLENWCYRLPRADGASKRKKHRAVRLMPVSVRPEPGAVLNVRGQIVIDVRSLLVAVNVDHEPEHVANLVAAIRRRVC
jgi:hypothetical protein